MARRARRGPLIQELGRSNPWWTNERWQKADPQLAAATRAPFDWAPEVLDDIVAPNLYTLRGPRRIGKSTVLKVTVSRLCASGVDPRRITYFAADALTTFEDLINLFQAIRQLFPDLGDVSRYVFIDEVTSVPEWQRGIKWVRDNTRAVEDCIVASGSSAGDIGAGTGYLAGRRGPDIGLDRLLLPMSFPDFVRCAGYTLSAPAVLPLPAFYTEAGREACQHAR